MLQHLEINNFIKIPFLDLKPENPVILFAGRNESGKTSVAEAVRFLFRGENPRLALKRDRAKLLTNGASKGSVSISWDNNTVKRNIKDGKPAGDTQFLPDDELVADICFQAIRYATIDDKKRRTLTLKLAEIDLSVDVIAKKMAEKGIPADIVKKYRPLLVASVARAHDHAKTALTLAKGAWKEVTGEVYGSAKAEGWKPEESLTDDKDEVVRSLSETDETLVKLRADRDIDIAPISAKIIEHEQALAAPEPKACPECGSSLLIIDGELTAYLGGSVHKGKLESLLTGCRLKRAGLTTDYDNKEAALSSNKRTLEEQISQIDSYATKEKRAAELHEEAKTSAKLVELLSDGPDGIASSLIAQSMAPLNERLMEIGTEIGWAPAIINGDMSITRADGHPYALLSESAQWRIDTMLHILVSELAKFPWLIFDRMDLLDVAGRGQFIKWVAAYGQERTDEATILVMATLKQPPTLDKVKGIETLWME